MQNQPPVMEKKPGEEMPKTDDIVVTLHYNLGTNKFLMDAGGTPTLILRGILETAMASISEAQSLQRLQAAIALLKRPEDGPKQ